METSKHNDSRWRTAETRLNILIRLQQTVTESLKDITYETLLVRNCLK